MKTHELKTWPTPFDGVASGRKRHEIRVNDRCFSVGDVLRLREWIPNKHFVLAQDDRYTGREISVRVALVMPALLTRTSRWSCPASKSLTSCRIDC